MPVINVPGQGPVQFPDGMTDDQIVAAIQKNSSPSRTSTFLNGIAKGAAGFGDMVGNTLVNGANLGIMAYGVGKHALTGSTDLPETIDPNALAGFNKLGHATGAIRDSAELTDTTGRIIDFAGQAVGGGGINPASIARNAARGNVLPIVRDIAAALTSGAGAGVGNELTRNVNTGSESLDTAIRAAATMAGGGVGVALSARGTGGDRASAALKGVTPEQLDQAKTLAAKAAEAGTPITAYEAIQQVTGLNPKMQAQQRVTEQSDAAAHNLTPMMQARPEANAALFGRTADAISPAEQFPDVLAGQLQVASKDAITSARQAGNAQAAPFYAATSNNPASRIPSADWNGLVGDPLIQKALQATKGDPVWGVTNAGEGSLQWLDAAKQWLDKQRYEGKAAPQEARMYDAATNAIKGVADATFPDYAKARGIVSNNMQTVVKPMENSQVGKLAGTNDFRTQAGNLLPEAPLDVTPSVINRTAQTVGQQDPDILKRFLAQYLRGTFSEANQSNAGGQNVMGGAKFAAKVAGNPQQADNLAAALTAAGANPQPFNDALDVFRAQGMKPAVNSATASNMNESSLMGGQKLADLLMRPLKTGPGIVDNWRNGWATQGLAKALSSGKTSVQDIEALARANGAHQPTAQQLLISALLANRASSATQ